MKNHYILFDGYIDELVTKALNFYFISFYVL